MHQAALLVSERRSRTIQPGGMLTLDEIRFGFADRPEFLGPISLRIDIGQCWAVVGPNGAGKSTLLRLIAGLYAPQAGRIELSGRDLAGYSRRARARQIAFVPQRADCDFELSVREVVLMGRFPHRSFGFFESAEDHRLAEEAMARTTTLEFADRPISTLSGGEAQRVHIAAALAQRPPLLLLDEPTASLDLQHERLIFELLARQAGDNRLAVVVVTHDINLAADFCTHALLLHQGKAIASGPPQTVLRPDLLNPVYGVDLEAVAAPGRAARRWLIPAVWSGEGEPSE
jgi:iron complex transport system ATP-binding protein